MFSVLERKVYLVRKSALSLNQNLNFSNKRTQVGAESGQQIKYNNRKEFKKKLRSTFIYNNDNKLAH